VTRRLLRMETAPRSLLQSGSTQDDDGEDLYHVLLGLAADTTRHGRPP